jgi:AcrR family transcriptional regulator
VSIAPDRRRPGRGVSSKPAPDQPLAIPRGGGLDAITTAAREIFAERGYHGASVRDIAQRAGLSMSALYHWYPSKQHLLAVLIEDSSNDYRERCERALADAADDPVDRLRVLVRVTIEYRVERRIDSNISNLEWRNLDAENRAHLAKLRRASTRIWTRIIVDGVAEGVFRCAHPEDARRTIIAACNAITEWYKPSGKLRLPDLVDRYTEIALRVVDARDRP